MKSGLHLAHDARSMQKDDVRAQIKFKYACVLHMCGANGVSKSKSVVFVDVRRPPRSGLRHCSRIINMLAVVYMLITMRIYT